MTKHNNENWLVQKNLNSLMSSFTNFGNSVTEVLFVKQLINSRRKNNLAKSREFTRCNQGEQIMSLATALLFNETSKLKGNFKDFNLS